MTFALFAPDPTAPETQAERQRATYAAARRMSDPIECFADWLATVWDFDPDAVNDHDISLMTRVLAWIETMPAEMRDAYLAHVKTERAMWRQRNPGASQRPVTVLGVTLPGVGR